MRSLLGEKFRKKEIIVIDKIQLTNFKTKEAEQLMSNLLVEKPSSLVVLGSNEENKKRTISAFRNLPYV